MYCVSRPFHRIFLGGSDHHCLARGQSTTQTDCEKLGLKDES